MPPAPISVVIPTYNRRRTLRRALASVRRQSLQPLEIIVVDDGSTDGTPEDLAAMYEPRPRCIRHDCNRGPAAARNAGVRAATGRWIAFLDSDDEWLPGKLERQLALLSAAPAGTLAAVTGYAIEDARHGTVRTVRPTARHGSAAAMVWGCSLSPGSTLLVAPRAFESVGPLDERLRRFEDWDWLMRFTRAHPLLVVEEPLARIHKAANPSRPDTDAAIAWLRDSHWAYWRGKSWIAARKFDSSLLVEEAAGAYYDGDHHRMARLMLRAIAAYPFRNPAFFAMLARNAAALLAGRTVPRPS